MRYSAALAAGNDRSVRLSAIPQTSRDSDIQAFRHSGIQTFRHSDIQAHGGPVRLVNTSVGDDLVQERRLSVLSIGVGHARRREALPQDGRVQPLSRDRRCLPTTRRPR